MLIAVDCTNLYSGGSRTHLRNFLFYKPSHINIVLVAKNKLDFKEFEVPGVEIYVLPFLFRRIPAIWHLFHSKFFYEKREVNVLFSPGGFNLSRFETSVVMCRNFLFFDKDSVALYSLKNRLLLHLKEWLSIYSYRNSSDTIFISNNAKGAISNRLGDTTRTHLVHHGISVEFARRWRKPPLESTVNIVYTSAFEPYKLHLNLLDILDKLVMDSNFKVRLTCIGSRSHSAYYRQVQDKIKALKGKLDYIEFSGLSHEDIVDIYSDSHLFIFPSMCENMPNAVLEAKRYCIPLAAFERSGTAEFLEENDIRIDPFDVQGSVLSIIDFLDTYEYRDLPVSKHSFTWEKTVSETYKIIECADLMDL